MATTSTSTTPTPPKIALVTGASRGIGAAIARRLASDGHRVAVHYGRSRSAAEAVLASLPGGGHTLAQAEMADAGAVAELVEATARAMGGLDVVVNNAGIYREHPATDIGYDAWQRAWRDTLEVNLIGPANLMFCALPHLLERGGGTIVNITSRGAFRGEPTAPAYGASKAGLNAAGQSLARALGGHGVSVFTVAPGWVASDMAAPHLQGEAGDEVRRQSPLGRVARPEEIANLVAFLVAGGTDYLTGAIIDVNGASYLRS